MSDYKKKVSAFDIMEDLSLFGADFSSYVPGVTFTPCLTDFNEIIILSGYRLISSFALLFIYLFIFGSVSR